MMLESNKKGLFECGYIILVPYRRVKTLPQESMYEVDAPGAQRTHRSEVSRAEGAVEGGRAMVIAELWARDYEIF